MFRLRKGRIGFTCVDFYFT